jgi:hypothetical protein
MDPNTNLRMLRDSGKPLGVLCTRCFHRALIEYSTLIAKHGLMRKVCDIRFRCTRCRSRSVQIEVFWRPSAMKRFMRSD